MRRMEVVCTEFSGSTEAAGHPTESIHSPEDVPQKHVSFRVFVLTFHHQVAQVDLVEVCQVQDVMLHQVVEARTNYRCLDLVCFVGPNQ